MNSYELLKLSTYYFNKIFSTYSYDAMISRYFSIKNPCGRYLIENADNPRTLVP